ncbi:MAG: hypothetical protein KatS3mg108_1082 [Isosphaeraceae bacterium]|nr:MAG: hypothetical protein KatS3mg108_1082 [Isosphaeraceae bacterium]
MPQHAAQAGKIEGGELLPSRLAAWTRLQAGLAEATPVLLTGEPGSGKSWLARRLITLREPRTRWLWIDVGPDMTPAELLQAILETLGMPSEGQRSAGSLRLELRAILAQLSEDGWQTGLVVDELQLAGPRLFEELRLLVNGMGTAGGGVAVASGGSDVGASAAFELGAGYSRGADHNARSSGSAGCRGCAGVV